MAGTRETSRRVLFAAVFFVFFSTKIGRTQEEANPVALSRPIPLEFFPVSPGSIENTDLVLPSIPESSLSGLGVPADIFPDSREPKEESRQLGTVPNSTKPQGDGPASHPAPLLKKGTVPNFAKSAQKKVSAGRARNHPEIDFDGANGKGESLDDWISLEEKSSLAGMMKNISPAGAAKGAVAASPSRSNPDYWYHWVRDAGLTMNAAAALYQNEKNPAKKQVYLRMMRDYVRFSRANQLAPTLAGLGEPKFNMDGTPFNGPWGRPQDDGPAIRAIALIRFAKTLLGEGPKGRARARSLYDGKLPTHSVIKADLEYVANFWRQTSYDIWEEVRGHHFYTRMLERKALLSGARLARAMADPGAADFYEGQAALLSREIERHWNPGKGQIDATLDQDAGLTYKKSGLDSAVILAALQGDFEDGFFSATDERVLATAVKISAAFKALYPVNNKPDAPGNDIGRYPEDRYFGGNPWVILTNTFGQFYRKLEVDWIRQGSFEITSMSLPFFESLNIAAPERLRAGLKVESSDPLFGETMAALRGETSRSLETIRRYSNPDGSLSEQMDRETGAMISARDLTWNYVSFLREACEGRACLLGPARTQKERSR